MKSFRYLGIFLCLLLCGLVNDHTEAGEKIQTSGDAWNSSTDVYRDFYLSGLRDGILEGEMEYIERLKILNSKGRLVYNGGFTKLFEDLFDKTLSMNFPEMETVRDVMTKFYADPSNKHLSVPTVFLISVAEIRGSSAELIKKMLATARKESYNEFMFKKTRDKKYLKSDGRPIRKLFYEEVLKIK